MYQPFNLTGRGAVVTGGNGGIGLGMARALLSAGASVAIWGSNPDKTKQAQQQLAKECEDAARVHAFVCDVGSEAEVEATFAASVNALGQVHACFANAGVSGKGTPMLEMSLSEFQRVQRINVEGVFLTFRAAARHMVERGDGGALIATASPLPPDHHHRFEDDMTSTPTAQLSELGVSEKEIDGELKDRMQQAVTRLIDRQSGVGDMYVRTKWRFYESTDTYTSIALLPYVKFPTNTGGVGNDAVEGGLIVPVIRHADGKDLQSLNREIAKGWYEKAAEKGKSPAVTVVTEKKGDKEVATTIKMGGGKKKDEADVMVQAVDEHRLAQDANQA